MNQFLAKAFGFDPEKHNVRTEIVAGITTFLTMAYILAVNPSIFSVLPGMPNGSVFTVCLTMGYSWQFALTAVFIEGIILRYIFM